MKGFRFRLESLVTLRGAELDACHAELEQARRARDEARGLAHGERERARTGAESLALALASGIQPAALRSAHEAQHALHEASRRAEQRAEDSSVHAEGAHARVLEAWRATRMLDALRRKALRSWRRESERREQRALDDLPGRTCGGFGRKLVAVALLVLAAARTAPAEPQAEPAPAVGLEERTQAPAAGIEEKAQVAAPAGGDLLPAETLSQVLSELGERERSLERRERDLEQRERVADDMAADTKRLLAEIEAIRAAIEQRLAEAEGETKARIGRLAKVYEAMPPAQAAPLLEEMEPALATAIVAKMKPKKSAAVLAAMARSHALRMSEAAADPLKGVGAGPLPEGAGRQ